MLSPLSLVNVVRVLDNPVASSKNAVSCAFLATIVLPVTTVLRSRRPSSGIASA